MACLAELLVPLHVTGLWLPVWRRSPLATGSLGAGLVLGPPAVARIEECRGGGRCGVVVEDPGGRLHRPPGVVLELLRLNPGLAAAGRVTVRLPVPLGVGYAGSAVVAIAAAVGLGLAAGGWEGSLEEHALLAHVAEVEAGTGLGDVAAIIGGGMLELRLSPGPPGVARVERVPVPPGLRVVAVETGGPMETGEMHRRLRGRLEALAAPRLGRVFRRPSLEVFLEEARGFSLEAGFAPGWLASLLDEAVDEGLALGWYAKKRVAVAVAPGQGEAMELAERLRGRGLEARIMEVDPGGVRLRGC